MPPVQLGLKNILYLLKIEGFLIFRMAIPMVQELRINAGKIFSFYEYQK